MLHHKLADQNKFGLWCNIWFKNYSAWDVAWHSGYCGHPMNRGLSPQRSHPEFESRP